MADHAVGSDDMVTSKFVQLKESWSDQTINGLGKDELCALQDARLQAWLSAFVKHYLPLQFAQSSSSDAQHCVALGQKAMSPLDACMVHQPDVLVSFWNKAVPEVSSAVAAASTIGRSSPAATSRASQAAAQFLAALAEIILSPLFLKRVFRAAAGTDARLPAATTLSALWTFPARAANAIGALDAKHVPACVSHDAVGGAFSEALLAVLWEAVLPPAGKDAGAAAPVRNLKDACVRIRQSSWSVHLAGAAAAAFFSTARHLLSGEGGEGGVHRLLLAHETVSTTLWEGATRAQCESAVMHLMHSPPAPLPAPLASSCPVAALPLFAGIGPASSTLCVPSALAGTIKRSIPQRRVLTAYGARQWLLYCRSGVTLVARGGGLSWAQCFDAQALADAWSLPLSIAALDTDLQQSMTGLLAFLVRNAPPQQVLLGTPFGTSLMRGVQERLGAPNLRVKAAGMLIGSILSRAAAAASKSVLGVQLPVLDWTAAVAPEIQTDAEKQASKAAADSAAEEAFGYLHIPLGDLRAEQNAVLALRDTWQLPALPTGLPPPALPPNGQAPTAPQSTAAHPSGAVIRPAGAGPSTQLSAGGGAVLARGGTAIQFDSDPLATLATHRAPPAEFPDDAPRDEPAVLLGQPLPQGADGGGAVHPPPQTALAFALRMAQATQRDKTAPGSKEQASVAAAASGVATADGFTRATAPPPAAQAGPPHPALADAQGGKGGGDRSSAGARPAVPSNVPAAKYGQLPAPPSHLREIMKTLRDPPDYKHYISALAAVGPLVRALKGRPATAHEIHDTAVPLLRVLLGASNQFGLVEFAEWQQDALVAVAECSPILAAQWLTKVVFAQEQLLGVRIQVLHILASAALALANTLPPCSRAGAGGVPVSAGDDASVNALIEELVHHAGGTGAAADQLSDSGHEPAAGGGKRGGVLSDGGRTRRWGHGAAKARRKGTAAARVNAFAGVAGEFILPLLRRVMDPSSGVNVLGLDGAEVLAALCRTLALMLEAAGSAPNVSMLCGEVLHFVRVVHSHDSAGVRVGALCIVLACAEIVHRLQLHEHSMPPAVSSFLTAAVGGGVGQDAELLRSALGEGSPGGQRLTAPAGGATAAVTRQLQGTRTLLSAMAQRQSVDALGSAGAVASQGEALQELAAWVAAVAAHDPDAECRALAQRVAAAPSLQQLAHTQSAMVSLLGMMDM